MTITLALLYVAAMGVATTTADPTHFSPLRRKEPTLEGDGLWLVGVRFDAAPHLHRAACPKTTITIDGMERLDTFVPPHEWTDLAPAAIDAATTLVPREVKAATTVWDVATYVDSPTVPQDSQNWGRLIIASSSVTGQRAAHSFVDPRYIRLHEGHHGPHSEPKSSPRLAEPPAPLSSSAHGHHDHHAADKTLEQEKGTTLVWVPHWATHVEVYCAVGPRTTAALSVNLRDASAQQRPFHAQDASTASQPEVRTLNAAGPPESQYNVIFLSAGYQASQKEMFFKNITDINKLLQDPQLNPNLPADTIDAIYNMHRTVPFNRYWAFWNVFAVFQPSVDVGASRPLLKLTVNNNLDCVHPANMERAVQCDPVKAFALASVTSAPVKTDPDRCVIISIVNTALYGGSARYDPGRMHLGNFFNGFNLQDPDEASRMLSLVDHEIGHALGNLFDEYSVGISEPKDRNLLNCQYSADSNSAPTMDRIRWKHWITMRQAESSNAAFTTRYGNGLKGVTTWDVLTTPQAVCGYTNYFKPNANCMMNRLNDYFMCPVCREAATLSVLKTTFQLSWPRKPLLDSVMVIPKTQPTAPAGATASQQVVWYGSNVIFHLPAILTPANGFTVTFRDTDNTVIPKLNTADCPACIMLNSTHFSKYPTGRVVYISVDIVDSTANFVSPTQMPSTTNQTTQRTYFQLMIIDSINGTAAPVSGPATTMGPSAAAPGGNGSASTTSGTAGATTNGYSYSAGGSSAVSNVVGIHDADTQGFYYICQAFPNATGLPSNRTPLCVINFTSRQYNNEFDVGDFLAQYDTYSLIGLGVFAMVLIMLWMCAANKFNGMSRGVVRPIFKEDFSFIIGMARRIMLLASVCFLVASLGAIGVAAYYYYNTTTVGRLVIIAGIALAILLYIMAFVGFWSVSSRSKRFLCINGFVLLIGIAFLLVVAIFVKSIGGDLEVVQGQSVSLANIQGTNVSNQVNSFWTDQLYGVWIDWNDNAPDRVCAIQNMFKCSGFNQSCTDVVVSSQQCPRNCQESNSRFSVSCSAVLRMYIVDNYGYISNITFACVGMVFGGFILNWVYFGGLWMMKKRIQQRLMNRMKDAYSHGHGGGGGGGGGQYAGGATGGGAVHSAPQRSAGSVNEMNLMMILKTLDSANQGQLMREFHRIDQDGNGKIERMEFAVFVKKTLCYKATKGEIDEVYKLADVDGDDTISLPEFLALFSQDDEHTLAKLIIATKLQQAKKKRGQKGPVQLSADVEEPLLQKYEGAIREVRRRINERFNGALESAPVPDCALTRHLQETKVHDDRRVAMDDML